MIKHGLTMIAAVPGHEENWDAQLQRVLFGYRCGVQESTKFSHYMILTWRIPQLTNDSRLADLCGPMQKVEW